MQNDPVLTASDPDNIKSDSPQKYIVVSEKSVSTYESDQTGGSKRSTEEEELRSLSTTPRYSHEDLGRIVSPPHSSDFSTEIEPDVNDSLSSREVNLKSRTSQFTQQNTLPAFLSDQDSLYSQLTQKTLSDKTWAKPVKQPYNKTFQNFEKTISSSGRERHSKEFSISDQLSLKSNVTSTATAPDFASLKGKSVNPSKPAYSDHDLKKVYKLSLGNPEYRRLQDLRYGRLRPLEGTDYSRLRAEELMEMRLSGFDADLKTIMMDAEHTHRDLMSEHDHRKMLETQLEEINEERKELNSKLATLRVKLGVASSNYNVSKNECDHMRKKFQETQIQKARLEERIQTCTQELARLKDPNNPNSNVNMKKIVLNDRKEIRRLRTELEGVRSERSEIQKQIQDKDEKIKMLNIYIGETKDQLDECTRDFEVAKISVTGERKKREEVEAKYNEIMKDKIEFDKKMAEIQAQLDTTVSGTTGVLKQSEQIREKEQILLDKIDAVEKKLRDTLTAVEQQKNRNMPFRTATSIKDHQYRLTSSGWITDTTPHVIVTTNSNGSIAASGYLGKTVVSTKPAKSLPAGKAMPKTTSTPRSKGGSLPDRK